VGGPCPYNSIKGTGDGDRGKELLRKRKEGFRADAGRKETITEKLTGLPVISPHQLRQVEEMDEERSLKLKVGEQAT